MALVAHVTRRWAGIAVASLVLGACAPKGDPDASDGNDVVSVIEAGVDATGDQLPDNPVLHPDDTGAPITCQDSDGDGFGQNCARGIDCNDLDPNITDQCYRCMRPATGCACTTEGQHAACDAITDGDATPGPDGTCHLGDRVCQNGQWTRCQALDSHSRTITPPSPCGSACSPSCRVETVCPDSTADLSGHSTGVVIGSTSLPGFCPTPTGGLVLQPLGGYATDGGAPITGCSATGGTDCGGSCCNSRQTCMTLTDTTIYPSWCYGGTRVPPPPVSTQQCAVACTGTSFHCGDPPYDTCCTATQQCRFGVCRDPGGACRTNADCPAGQFCDNGLNRCFPSGGGRCNCEGDTVQQGCLNSILAQGGDVVNDIFHTADGHDARSLRFATYMRGLENNPSSCVIGRSNYQATGAFACTTCDPTQCDAYQCFWDPGAGGAFHNSASISPFANGLDWLWTQHLRFNPSTGAAVGDGDGRFYLPQYGAIYDLGAPANRVVVFPITDHVNDSCLEPFEYTIWLSDNPTATTIAPASNPDPAQWNLATLVTVYTQGWTRNPRAIGVPTDGNDIESTAFGDAVSDGMTTVWALPCGYSFRYASISAGNLGNPTGSCGFNSADYELDAIAGLNVEGNPLSIYHQLPYGTSAGPDSISFSTQVRTADVYFLFDTTGSMGGELANLQTSMTSGTFVTGCSGGIIGGIRCIIPDAWFGVGRHDDFAVSPYGSPGIDVNFQHVLNMTSSISSTAAAVNALTIHYGNDEPEIQVPSLWAVATGRGIPPYWNAQTGCTGGAIGYPCFRPGSIPIVMLFTDATYHNGPGGWQPYSGSVLFGGGSGATSCSSPAGTTLAYTPSGGSGGTIYTGSWGPFNGSGTGGGSGATCFGTYTFPTIAGGTYTISTCGSYGGDTYLRVSGSCTCANDDYCGLGSQCTCTATTSGTATICASTYGGSSGSWSYTVTGPASSAATSWGPFSGSGSGGGSGATCIANYSFPTVAGATYRITTCDRGYGGDTWMRVTGTCSCSNDDFCGLGSECSCTATSTGTATICASTWSSASASWNYTVTTTAGGSSGGTGGSMAIPSDTASYTITGTTVGLSHSAYGVSCAADTTGPDAVFTITIGTAHRMHFDSIGSGFDTGLAIYNSSGTVLACNDDSCGSVQSAIELDLPAGTYTIVLGGYANSSGAFVFHSSPVSTTAFPFVPQFSDAVAELNNIGAKVIVINSCGTYGCTDVQNQALALANGTTSLVSGGTPAVYQISPDGTGLGASVVNAVRDLANYSRMDVSAVAQDNPATPTVDERCFVNNPAGTPAGTIRLSNPALGESAPYASGRCVDPPTSVGGVPVIARQCLPGSQVNFRAEFLNDCVMATSTPQTFTFNILTYGNGSYVLGTTPVTIVVPAFGYPASGTFFYDVDATTVCAAGEYPDWTQVEFVSTTPTGTSINVDVQTASTTAGLGAAPLVRLGTNPPAVSPLLIGPALVTAGQPTHLPALRVTFTLNSDATRTSTPVLSGYRVLFNCIAGF